MPVLDNRTIEFISNGVEQTVRLGVRLGELLQPGDFVSLSGELGAGKTAFTRGVGRGWGSSNRVTSPTFNLINQYPRYQDGCILYHLDCYRLEGVADGEGLGLDEILDGDGVVIMEWPERIADLLPRNRLAIDILYYAETRRRFRFRAIGERAEALLATFKQRSFGV